MTVNITIHISEATEHEMNQLVGLVGATDVKIECPLTPRQLEALILVRRGFSYKQVAKELRISPDTVRQHMANIREKLGSTTPEAILRGLKEGWFEEVTCGTTSAGP